MMHYIHEADYIYAGIEYIIVSWRTHQMGGVGVCPHRHARCDRLYPNDFAKQKRKVRVEG